MAQGEGEDAIFTLKEKQIVSPGTWKLITTIQRGENGAPISRVCETYAVTRNGNLCTSRIEGYGTDYARETTYEYTGMEKLRRKLLLTEVSKRGHTTVSAVKSFPASPGRKPAIRSLTPRIGTRRRRIRISSPNG